MFPYLKKFFRRGTRRCYRPKMWSWIGHRVQCKVHWILLLLVIQGALSKVLIPRSLVFMLWVKVTHRLELKRSV